MGKVSIESLPQRKYRQLHNPSVSPSMYVSVEGHTFDESSNAVFYHIETGVKKDDSVVTFRVNKRYSELRKFDKLIRLLFKGSEFSSEFPPKRIFGNKDPVFIEKRADELQNYLMALFKVSGVASTPHFYRFFGIDDKLLSS